MQLDLPYDDPSVLNSDRLFRCYAWEWYSPTLAATENPTDIGAEALTGRLSKMGFQSLPDRRSGVLGMSVYVERLLPEVDAAEALRRWWVEERASGKPHSVVSIEARTLRDDELGLAITMDELDDEPFGAAHANVTYATENPGKFTASTRRKITERAVVVLP